MNAHNKDPAAGGDPARRVLPAASPAISTAGQPGRFAVYFIRRGWIHALLLLGAWMFLFPFLWMFATSVKTDEELLNTSAMPQWVSFHPDSPYVRNVGQASKPADVAGQRWNQMLPRLIDLASAAIGRYQAVHPPLPIATFDVDAYRHAAAIALVNNAVAKIDRRSWTGPNQTLLDQFSALLGDAAVANSLLDSLGRLELLSFQLRTLDLRIFNLTQGAEFGSSWRVESGSARMFNTGLTTLLSYHFDSASADPVVLRYDFHLPPGVGPSDLHKLSLSLGADNSWHRLTATMDVAGDRWATDEPMYIAQYRPMSFIMQPPTFDDQTGRAKIWVSLRKVGPAAPLPDNLAADKGISATLRIIITPSGTLRANWAKTWRNYDRAFKSVPFWRYIGNSLLLVFLCTIGSLFSAGFVGYAFARLHWPGRTAAFLLVLSTMMLPAQVTMIPGFMIWRSLHWYNTLNPLWVPAFFGSGFFIFLMTQQMRTIPRDLEEAARLDGLNALQSWYYIILPNVAPTLAAIAILAFMGSWNEFMGPLIYLRDQARFPLSLGLYAMSLLRTQTSNDYSWSVIMAGNMMMTVPVIVVFFLFQRYFIQGVTLTGMKG